MIKVKEYLKAGGFSSAAATTLIGAYFMFIAPQISFLKSEIKRIDNSVSQMSSEILSNHLRDERFREERDESVYLLREEIIELNQKIIMDRIRIHNLESFVSKKEPDFTVLSNDILNFWR